MRGSTTNGRNTFKEKMAMRKVIMVAGLGVSLLVARSLSAQNTSPMSIEVRAGAAVPTGEFGDGNNTGTLIGAALKYRVGNFVTAYGGYERARFDSNDPDVPNTDAGIQDSGYRFGLELAYPFASDTRLNPYVQAGATFDRTELKLDQGSSGNFTLTSGREIGYELGVGTGLKIGRTLSLTPEVRYRNYQPKFNADDTANQHLSYISASIGLDFRP
jgi:opacity protein-like surface antigen